MHTTEASERLTGALIGLARAASVNGERVTTDTCRIVRDALCSGSATLELLSAVAAEKARLAPGCSLCEHPCGRTGDYDMADLLQALEAIRGLKTALLVKLRLLAEDACHTAAAGRTDEAIDAFLLSALDVLGNEWAPEDLEAFLRRADALHLHHLDTRP